MLEEAAKELLGGDGAVLELVSGRLFVRESDLAIVQLAEAVVADGHAKDVRGEIFEGRFAAADRFGMDHPVFLPNRGLQLNKEFSLYQLITKLGAEDFGESFDRDQEVFA